MLQIQLSKNFILLSMKMLKPQRVNRTTRSNKGTKRNVCPPTFFILSKLHIARDETSEHRSAMIFETVSNLFNDFLLDRDPIRSGKNRRAGLLYSLGSEVCTKIFLFFFSFFSFESLASKKILVQKFEQM